MLSKVKESFYSRSTKIRLRLQLRSLVALKQLQKDSQHQHAEMLTIKGWKAELHLDFVMFLPCFHC